MPATLNIDLYAGDFFTKSFALKTRDPQGAEAPLDISNVTFAGHIRKTYGSTDYVPFDINVDDVNDAKITIYLSSPTTKELKTGQYVYDIEIIEDSDNIYKVLVGTINIKPEATIQ